MNSGGFVNCPSENQRKNAVYLNLMVLREAANNVLYLMAGPIRGGGGG